MTAALQRRRGPLVRYWDAEFTLLHTEPVTIKSWSAWLTRQLGRLFRACT